MRCCPKKEKVANYAFLITMNTLGVIAPMLSAGGIALAKIIGFCDDNADICSQYQSRTGHDRAGWIDDTAGLFFLQSMVLAELCILAGLVLRAGLLYVLKKCLWDRGGESTPATPLHTTSKKGCLKTYLMPNPRVASQLGVIIFCSFLACAAAISIAAFGVTWLDTQYSFFSNLNATQTEKLDALSDDMTWTIFPACLVIGAVSVLLTGLVTQFLDAWCKQCLLRRRAHAQIDSSSGENLDDFGSSSDSFNL